MSFIIQSSQSYEKCSRVSVVTYRFQFMDLKGILLKFKLGSWYFFFFFCIKQIFRQGDFFKRDKILKEVKKQVVKESIFLMRNFL